MNNFIKQAIELSNESVKQDGFPAGAVIVKDNVVIAQGLSLSKTKTDVTCHAEIEAIRNASQKLNTKDLFDCEIYTSMEPCIMCFSALYWAGIKKVVYAIGKDKLSKKYYEGLNSLSEINLKNNKQIDIMHFEELENEALSVVRDWER